MARRRDLELIVTSDTMNAERVSIILDFVLGYKVKKKERKKRRQHTKKKLYM